MAAVGVLGPLLLRGPDGPIRLGSARQRQLLAALVAHLGSAIGTELLAELVWGHAGDEPPADPAGAVQTNVARLRRLLPAGIRIATTSQGYQLLADRAAVDATAFADQVAAAATMTEPQQRLRLLASGLALWRGRPYAELDHPSVHPEVARLTELHAGATEQHAAALLAVGRTAEAIAALEALTVAEPLREGAVAWLMRGLVTAGRQSDALAAFGRLRTRLADELGLDPAPELRALEQQILRQELPTPAPPAVPTPPAIPAPPAVPEPQAAPAPRLPVSSFVGRAAALAAGTELLARCRVVTLCGPGGVGKTRLAAHITAEVADRYDDGVLLVGFGDSGPADVEPALAAALRLSNDGVRDAGGRDGAGSFTDRIVEVLAVRRQLLVLDNCEHVADKVAALVEAITVHAPGVDLLLTSREPLRVDGEHVLGIEPLGPEPAAVLLNDRIRAVHPGAPAEPGYEELVARLCRRLDGLPLALELAAARVPALGLRGLLDTLEHPFELLRGGRRMASARHRSLRDVVEWSYSLLDPEQRMLFERLSVFAGPVEYPAVVAVCGDAAALPDLIDRSLVVRHPGEIARFGLLETLRAFGRSRLTAGPEAARLRARHAVWALRLADEIAARRRGPGEAAAVRRFDAHLADLRRAHSWLCETGPTEDLLRLNVLFGELGYLRGRIDLIRMVEEALTVAGMLGARGTPGATSPLPGAAHPLAARLLGLLATSSWQRGDLDTAEAQSRHAIATGEATGEPAAAAPGYESLANVLSFRGDLAGALRHAERARELAEAADDVESQFLAVVDLVTISAYAGDDGACYEAALANLVAQLGSPTARAWAAYARGERRAELGDPDAVSHLEAAIRTAEEVDSGFVAGIARHTLLTSVARGSGDPAAALVAFGPLIDHWHGFGSWTQLWIAIRALIETLSRLGRHRDVAVLLGAQWASPRAPRVFGADSARARAVEQAARTALDTAFETLRAEGAALGDPGAVALARHLTHVG